VLVNTDGEEFAGGELAGGDVGSGEDDGGIAEEDGNEEDDEEGTKEAEWEDEEEMLEAVDGVDTVERSDELGAGDEKRLSKTLPIFPKPPPVCPVGSDCEGVGAGDGVRAGETWFEPLPPPRISPKLRPLLGTLSMFFLPFVYS